MLGRKNKQPFPKNHKPAFEGLGVYEVWVESVYVPGRARPLPSRCWLRWDDARKFSLEYAREHPDARVAVVRRHG